jgi:hypothetical protein
MGKNPLPLYFLKQCWSCLVNGRKAGRGEDADVAGQDIDYEDYDNLRAQPTPRKPLHVALSDMLVQGYADSLGAERGVDAFGGEDDAWARATGVGARWGLGVGLRSGRSSIGSAFMCIMFSLDFIQFSLLGHILHVHPASHRPSPTHLYGYSCPHLLARLPSSHYPPSIAHIAHFPPPTCMHAEPKIALLSHIQLMLMLISSLPSLFFFRFSFLFSAYLI